jgi:glycosyltransferase involved in cell wall biosynthesis
MPCVWRLADGNPHLICLHRASGEHPLAQVARAHGLAAQTIADLAAWSLQPFSRLRALRRDARPALIHTVDYRSDVLAWWIAGRTPWLAESHGHTQESARMALWNHLDLWALRRARTVVAVSTAWETALAAAGVSPGRLRVIGNSRAVLISHRSKLATLQASPTLRTADTPSATPVELPGPGPHLLYAGRYSYEKGIDLLLAAWPAMRERWPAACLWILGTPPVSRGFRRRLASLAAQDGLHFLGYRPDIRPWILAAHAVVAPSRREAWGMTVFEALCAGKPVLATRVGGLASLCRPAPHAYLVTPNQPLALVQGLDVVLRPDFPRGAEYGRTFCMRLEFDPQRRHDLLVACYRQLS